MYMKEFIRFDHKLSLWISLAALVILAIVTTAACAKWGTTTGLTIGFLAFIVLGGFEAFWYLLTRRLEQRIDEKVNQDQIRKSYSSTEDNPTIR